MSNGLLEHVADALADAVIDNPDATDYTEPVRAAVHRKPYPITQESRDVKNGLINADQLEFLKAVSDFRSKNHRLASVLDHLAILKDLGYTK